VFLTKEIIEMEEVEKAVSLNQALDQSLYIRIIDRPWIFRRFAWFELFFYKRLRPLIQMGIVFLYTVLSFVTFLALVISLYDGQSLILIV